MSRDSERKALAEIFKADCEAVKKHWNGTIDSTKIVGMKEYKIRALAHYLGLTRCGGVKSQLGISIPIRDKDTYITFSRKLIPVGSKNYKLSRISDNKILVEFS